MGEYGGDGGVWGGGMGGWYGEVWGRGMRECMGEEGRGYGGMGGSIRGGVYIDPYLFWMDHYVGV